MDLDYIGSLLAGFCLAVFLLYILRPVAAHINLVDEPGERKLHDGAVPLIGGIAIFVAFSFAILTLNTPISSLRAFFAGSLVLIFTGVLDDLHELSATKRFIAQIFATAIMATWGGVVLTDFGYLVSTGFMVELGWLAVPVTVFAAIGVINALNMLDGVDGLAGFVSLISVIGMMIISFSAGETHTLLILGLLVAVLIAFLIFNLNCDHRDCTLVFMGDSGSMFLGFVLTWFFITLSQGESRAMSPVIALWLFAVPLIDTLTMIIHRLRQGRSPFSADREHLHHMLEKAGLGKRMILIVIVGASVLMAAMGLAGHYLQIPEPLMFYAFLGVFAAYLVVWKRLRVRD